MKKLIIFSLLLIVSCSSDDDSTDDLNNDNSQNNISENLLVNTIISTMTEGVNSGYTELKQFYYDEDKIVQIIETRYANPDLTGATWQTGLTEFTYNGDLIIEMRHQSMDIEGNGALRITSHQYDSMNRIIGYPYITYVEGEIYGDEDWSHTYNSDGTVTINSFTENSVNGVLTNCVNLQIENNNVVSQTACSESNYALNEDLTAIYDTHNNPFKNIKGRSSMFFKREGYILTLPSLYISQNNLLSKVYTNVDGDITEYDFTYQYNENEYPVTIEGNGWIHHFEYIEN